MCAAMVHEQRILTHKGAAMAGICGVYEGGNGEHRQQQNWIT